MLGAAWTLADGLRTQDRLIGTGRCTRLTCRCMPPRTRTRVRRTNIGTPLAAHLGAACFHLVRSSPYLVPCETGRDDVRCIQCQWRSIGTGREARLGLSRQQAPTVRSMHPPTRLHPSRCRAVARSGGQGLYFPSAAGLVFVRPFGCRFTSYGPERVADEYVASRDYFLHGRRRPGATEQVHTRL